MADYYKIYNDWLKEHPDESRITIAVSTGAISAALMYDLPDLALNLIDSQMVMHVDVKLGVLRGRIIQAMEPTAREGIEGLEGKRLTELGGWETMNVAAALGHALGLCEDDGVGSALKAGTRILNHLGVVVGNEYCNRSPIGSA